MAEYGKGPSGACGDGGSAGGEDTSKKARREAAERARQAAREQLRQISERRRLLAEATYDDGVEMALSIVATDKDYAGASEMQQRERAVAVYLDTVARHSNMNLRLPLHLQDMDYARLAAGDASALLEFEAEAWAKECADSYVVVEDFDDSEDEDEAAAPAKPLKPGSEAAAKGAGTEMESDTDTETDSDNEVELDMTARAKIEEERAYDADYSVESDDEC